MRQRREPPTVVDTETGTRARGQDSGGTASWSAIVDWAAAIVPLLAALTALAVWFGFQIVSSRTRYFGIDPSVLGFSTSDFVLRSVSALIRPMVYLLLAALVLIWVHVGVRWLLQQRHGRPRLSRGLQVGAGTGIAVGLVLVIVGAQVFGSENLGNYSFGENCQGTSLGRWWRPSVLPLGVVLIVYGVWLLRQLSRGSPASSAGWHRLVVVVSAVIVLVGTFWSFSLYANAAGALESHSYACHNFEQFPAVFVYSTKPLNLPNEDGVTTESIGDPGSQYHWRYGGLRLLLRSDDKYFLLPVDWLGQGDVAIVLPDSPNLRFEFSPPGVL